MKSYFPAVLIAVIVLGIAAVGQSNDERALETGVTKKAEAVSNKKRVNLYYHLGSIEMPATFKGEVTANWTDAWAGFIGSEDGSFKIGWRAGTIVYVRESRKDEIESISTELHGGNIYDVAVLTNKGEKTITAKIGWLEFSSVVDTDEKEELFWSILATYQKERCKVCISLPIKVEN